MRLFRRSDVRALPQTVSLQVNVPAACVQVAEIASPHTVEHDEAASTSSPQLSQLGTVTSYVTVSHPDDPSSDGVGIGSGRWNVQVDPSLGDPLHASVGDAIAASTATRSACRVLTRSV